MTLDEYLVSPDFQVFQDETLRHEAIRAAESILSRCPAIKRHQLHAIPAVVLGAGLGGLKALAGKQNEKNTNSANKAFWTEIDALLSKASTSEVSLFHFLKAMLLECGAIENEDVVQDKKEQKRLRKRNSDLIEIMMEQVLGLYFEHFNCHYFYKSRQGGAQ